MKANLETLKTHRDQVGPDYIQQYLESALDAPNHIWLVMFGWEGVNHVFGCACTGIISAWYLGFPAWFNLRHCG